MATEAALKRRIRELSSRLDEMASLQAAERARLERETDERVRRLHRELEQALAENKRRMDAEYTGVIRRLRDELDRELQAYAESLRRQSEKEARERRRLMEELQEANEELRREFEKLRSEEHVRSELGREMAGARSAEAEAQLTGVERLPHGFFFPHELDLLKEHLSFTGDLIGSGMYESALAAADAALSELQIFEIRVRQAQEEWEELYAAYARLAQHMHDAMLRFEEEPVSTVDGGMTLTAEDRSFWSLGKYPAIREQVETAYGLVRRVAEAGGVTACLREGDAPRGNQFLLQLSDLKRLNDHLSSVIEFIESETAFSAIRRCFGGVLAEAVEELGYYLVSEGFREDDPMDSYEVVMTVNGMDTVKLTLAPVRRDGVAVGTACLVSVNVVTTPEREFMEKMAEGVGRRAQLALAQLAEELEEENRVSVSWYAVGTQAKTAENARKNEPDLTALTRRRERKYG